LLWCGMEEALDSGTDAPAKVVVGLGNPGEQYARTRHNVGFMVLEGLAREASGSWSPYLLSRTCRVEIGGRRVLMAKPLAFMNHSGRAVQVLLSALRRSAEDLLLVVDDLNLPFGRIRVRERGTSGGHHGLDSVLTILNTDEIVRVRMGIGEEHMPQDKADFVLSDFPKGKQAELDEMIIRAGNAVKSIVTDGVAKTMAIFNA